MNRYPDKVYWFLMITGFIFFVLSSLGIFNGVSADISKFLYNSLGYTNRWSKSFGEPWFVHMNSNISAFGSKELTLIFTAIFSSYLFAANRKMDSYRFLISIIGGIIVLTILKLSTSTNETFELSQIYKETISNFPSGHAFIATILYSTIISLLLKKDHTIKLKIHYIISAAVIIFIVGISRITGSGHTITEVIAGWSSGLIWFSMCSLFFESRIWNKTNM